ncbi:MAG: hypothetical protein H7A41_03515 [Chlamydiales bacterium]|nr:hypothetical protein [Chlamydiales bacterium]
MVQIILKHQIVGANSLKFNNDANQPFTEVTYCLDLKGAMSEEFQAFLDALTKEDQTFESYEEWSLHAFTVMHELERLILSGKLNRTQGSIDVGDPQS